MTDRTVHHRTRQEGAFLLSISPAQAFPLFTAAGERLWAPGWDPLFPASEEQEAGLVFMTGHGGESTIWTVFDSDPEAGKVRYSRVTPGVRAGIVEVSLSSEGDGCRVRVLYDMTALPGSAPQALDAYRPPHFQAMLATWQALLEDAIGRQAGERTDHRPRHST